MNEPKRRGRPPKAKDAAQEHVGLVVGALKTPAILEPSSAQAYALRVWNGQNTELPRKVRLERVAKALEGQGMSMEGVEL